MGERLSARKKLLLSAMLFACALISFGAIELVARALFPQMAGHIVSSTKTRNKNFHLEPFSGVKMRVPQPDYEFDAESTQRVLLVMGDSITFGFGLAYQDIYWQRWQRVFDLRSDDPIQIISPAYMGNNFSNNTESIRQFIDLFADREIVGIVYQFNFNDILPLRAEAIRDAVHLTPVQQSLMAFRVKYLNLSVAQKVAAHYLNRVRHSLRPEDCNDLGVNALGEYTYAYGAKGFEEVSTKLWQSFDEKVTEIHDIVPRTPFFILVSPLSPHIDPHYQGNYSTFQPRFDCATIDPIEQLTRVAKANDIDLIDPTDYMAQIFQSSVAEHNPAQMYFFNDLNHFNEMGTSYFAEFSMQKLTEGLAREKPTGGLASEEFAEELAREDLAEGRAKGELAEGLAKGELAEGLASAH